MSSASNVKNQKETLQAYCDCAKRETTWVRAKGYESGQRTDVIVSGWRCLNCGKFRADTRY